MAEDSVRSTSLIEVLEVAVAAGAASHHTQLPARVEEYNPERQVVRVQPMVGSMRTDSDGVEHEELYPAIVEVPVAWPGAGGARLTFPLAAGDFGMLVFSDRSLDEWKVNRGVQPMVPKDPRNHALQDAVFLPGLRPPSNPWKGQRADAVTLGYANEQGQGMQVHITSGGIALGEPTPPDAVLKGTTYRSADAAFDGSLATAASTLSAAMASIISGGGVLAVKPVPVLSDINTIGSLLAALGTALAGYGTAEATAANTKEASASSFLSATVKVKG